MQIALAKNICLLKKSVQKNCTERKKVYISRWVKFEGAVEQRETRCSKPHADELRFESLMQLKKILKEASFLLDFPPKGTADLFSIH